MMTRVRLGLLCLLMTAACIGIDGPPAARSRVADLLVGGDSLHARALEPRTFEFPRDHGEHPEFRTEWWYFTGNVTALDGRELGYQLTFFRSALVDSTTFVQRLPGDSISNWRSRHAWMAHFAVTDLRAGLFRAREKFARGAAGLAGVVPQPFRIHLQNWSATGDSAVFPLRLRADADSMAIDLTLRPLKRAVLHGDAGLSAKGPEPGNASYYYSLTRLETTGTMRVGADVFQVTGWSWLDREWSTSVLGSGVVGWDWISLQLADTTELMVFQLRREDGTRDPFGAATFVDRDGSSRTFSGDELNIVPGRTWRSGGGAAYPVEWNVAVPRLQLQLTVTAAVNAQELDLFVRYWEGAVRAQGTRGGRPLTGRGYLEMTGYSDRTLRSR